MGPAETTVAERLPEKRSFGETRRVDTWWVQPLVVFLGLGAFVVYATWAAFQGEHYHWGPYLSPFYSPELFGESAHAWFGPKPGWWPGWLPWSPAFLILWAPGGFRLTCYYYRGAYYKAFWADPPSCTVGEPRKGYRGERSFPLVLQNVHRYFLYLAIPFLFFLSWDVWKALWWEIPGGGVELGIGVGTLVLAVNVVLLGGYTLGCHSLRHLIGGRLDRLAGRPVRFTSYRCVSCLNRRHMLWAWLSLVWVTFSDVYVRLVSMGVWTDWRIL
ncbi:MAG: succinate dehydrogenase [Gemmatimonadota bacterium]